VAHLFLTLIAVVKNVPIASVAQTRFPRLRDLRFPGDKNGKAASPEERVCATSLLAPIILAQTWQAEASNRTTALELEATQQRV
jgi:hypothetical protein